MITRENLKELLKELKQDKKFINKLKKTNKEYCLLELYCTNSGHTIHCFLTDKLHTKKIKDALDNGQALFTLEDLAVEMNIDI